MNPNPGFGSHWFRTASVLALGAIFVSVGFSQSNLFLSIANTRGVQYDEQSRIAYIATTGGEIRRYDVQSSSFLSSFFVPNTVASGIALSPDGQTLAITDGHPSDSLNGRVNFIHTEDGAVTPFTYGLSSSDLGTGSHAPVFVDNSKLWVTGNGSRGGIREINLTNSTVRNITNQDKAGPVYSSGSADRSTVAYIEDRAFNGGLLGYVNTATGVSNQLFNPTIPTTGSVIVANRNGTQFAVVSPTGDLRLFDRDLQLLNSTPLSTGVSGAAYGSMSDFLFLSRFGPGGAGIEVYNTNTLSLAGVLDEALYAGFSPGQARLEVAADDSYLFAVSSNGVGIYSLAAIPEPSTYAMLASGLVFVLVLFFRRKPLISVA